MKKKILIMGAVVFIVITIIGGYSVLNSLFPKAEPISLPDPGSTLSVCISHGSNTVKVEESEVATLLRNIREAQPTRKMSVHDYPTAKNYYTVIISESSNEQYYYFIYEEGSLIYIEMPYVGIYKADRQLLDFISKQF